MLRVFKTVLSLTLILSFSQRSFSQAQPEVVPIDLHKALELAKKNYPILKKRLAEKASAGEQLDAAMASYLPKMGFQTQALFGTSNQVRGANLGYEGMLVGLSGSVKSAYDWQGAWTSLATTMVDWQAFTFGRKSADYKLGQSKVELADQVYEQEIFEHQVKVADAYLLALSAMKFAGLQERNLKRTEDILSVTRANASSGLKAGIDSSIALAESNRALLQWMNSKANAKKYETILAELIGESGKELDIDSMSFFVQIPKEFNFESSVPENHPRLLTLKARSKVLEAELKRVRLGVRPELHLMGSFWGRGSGIEQVQRPDGTLNISSSISGLKFDAFNYVTGATLIWYPTRFFEVRKQISSRQYLNTALKEEYNAALLRTNTELKNSDIQFNLAYQSVQRTPVTLNAARQAFAQSLARYESGLENIMLLTQVTDLFIKAETEYLMSVNNVWRSLLIKAAAKGDFNVFLDQIPN